MPEQGFANSSNKVGRPRVVDSLHPDSLAELRRRLRFVQQHRHEVPGIITKAVKICGYTNTMVSYQLSALDVRNPQIVESLYLAACRHLGVMPDFSKNDGTMFSAKDARSPDGRMSSAIAQGNYELQRLQSLWVDVKIAHNRLLENLNAMRASVDPLMDSYTAVDLIRGNLSDEAAQARETFFNQRPDPDALRLNVEATLTNFADLGWDLDSLSMGHMIDAATKGPTLIDVARYAENDRQEYEYNTLVSTNLKAYQQKIADDLEQINPGDPDYDYRAPRTVPQYRTKAVDPS